MAALNLDVTRPAPRGAGATPLARAQQLGLAEPGRRGRHRQGPHTPLLPVQPLRALAFNAEALPGLPLHPAISPDVGPMRWVSGA